MGPTQEEGARGEQVPKSCGCKGLDFLSNRKQSQRSGRGDRCRQGRPWGTRARKGLDFTVNAVGVEGLSSGRTVINLHLKKIAPRDSWAVQGGRGSWGPPGVAGKGGRRNLIGCTFAQLGVSEPATPAVWD